MTAHKIATPIAAVAPPGKPIASLTTAAAEAYQRKLAEEAAKRVVDEDKRYHDELVQLYQSVAQLRGSSAFPFEHKTCVVAGRRQPTVITEGLIFFQPNDSTIEGLGLESKTPELALLFKCTCGRPVASPKITNLETLGEVLHEFQPTARCRQCERPAAVEPVKSLIQAQPVQVIVEEPVKQPEKAADAGLDKYEALVEAQKQSQETVRATLKPRLVIPPKAENELDLSPRFSDLSFDF